jgi:hypothetical protein
MPYTTFIEKKCPICKNQFQTKNRKKNTCSRHCAGLSTIPYHRVCTKDEKDRMIKKIKSRYETDPGYKDRVSSGLRRYYKANPEKIRRGDTASKAVGKSTKGKYKNPKNILEVSKRTTSKILKRLNIGCSRCGWNETVCDIHHIRGRKINDFNGHHNLCYLCPNCHRLAHEKKIAINAMISLDKYIENRWKEMYYG